MTISHLMVISDCIRREIGVYLIIEDNLAVIAEKRGQVAGKPVFMDIAVLDRRRTEEWLQKRGLTEATA
jgi:ribosomal protein L14